MDKLLISLLALSLFSPAAWTKPGYRPKFKKEASNMEWKGAFCGVSSPSYRIVYSNEEWKKLWEEIGNPAPSADFTRNFAVAVFAGMRNTGGYTVSFENPAEDASKLTVRYRISAPPKNSMVIQALTQPFAVRLYPRTQKSIAVEEINP